MNKFHRNALVKIICCCGSFLNLSTTTTTTITTAAAFQKPNTFGVTTKTNVAYRSNTENEIDILESAKTKKNELFYNDQHSKHHNGYHHQPQIQQQHQQQQQDAEENLLPLAEMAQRIETKRDYARDLSKVEFVPSEDFHEIPKIGQVELAPDVDDTEGHYPFAAMLQGSAPYIASHAEETAVFYVPGEWLHKENKLFDRFLEDVALSRLLGMKIVLVADCRFQADAYCDYNFEYPHECHNTLHRTTPKTLRQVEEEAGYIRFEVERKLNKCLKLHGGLGGDPVEGNVIGGNFYSARAFGRIRGEDFEHTGYVQKVYTDNIQQMLKRNDVVLLTTVGNSPTGGDSVNVNGHHLAASVASALGAYKLIYMANEGSVLSQRGQEDKKFFQEIPLSFAKDLCEYHKVQGHKTGFATFEQARQNLEPRAVELLLNLSWASWALENGVKRAHIVNPKDGALLEELFTSKNGANTCLYHDDENNQDDEDWLDAESDDWDAFFAADDSR